MPWGVSLRMPWFRSQLWEAPREALLHQPGELREGRCSSKQATKERWWRFSSCNKPVLLRQAVWWTLGTACSRLSGEKTGIAQLCGSGLTLQLSLRSPARALRVHHRPPVATFFMLLSLSPSATNGSTSW